MYSSSIVVPLIVVSSLGCILFPRKIGGNFVHTSSSLSSLSSLFALITQYENLFTALIGEETKEATGLMGEPPHLQQ